MIRCILSFTNLVWLSRNVLAAPALSVADIHHVIRQDTRGTDRDMQCSVFMPPDLATSDEECRLPCADSVAKAKAAGKTGSWGCLGDTYPDWQPFDGLAFNVSGGTCLCNNGFVNELADDFLEALPALAEITCNVFMSAINLVINIGAAAIPGVGEIVDAGLIAGVQVARITSYAYDAGQQGLNQFQNYAKPCGTTHLPEEMRKAFDILNNVPIAALPAGLTKAPRLPPKGTNGKPLTEVDPPKKTTPEATKADPPKASDPPKAKTLSPKTTEPPETSKVAKSPGSTPSTARTDSSESKKCSLQKRANGSNQQNCKNDDENVTLITESIADLVTYTKTCNGAHWPQACYHYYSAIKNGAKSLFTCSNTNLRAHSLKQTSVWLSQHTNPIWKQYKPSEYKFWSWSASGKVKCDRDEWPPGYFMSAFDKDIWDKEKDDPKININDKTYGQIIRWLPASENRGAGSLFKGFCKEFDGGEGNGQLVMADDTKGKFKKGQVNDTLVDLIRPGKENEVAGANGKTTTTTRFKAKYTRAVFTLDFDNSWPLKPSEQNDWGLKENPCWPKYIVDNDPGYVLMTDDNWYTTAGDQALRDVLKDQVKLYSEAPDAARIARAHVAIQQAKAGANVAPAPAPAPPRKRTLSSHVDIDEEDEVVEDVRIAPEEPSFHILDEGFAVRSANLSRRLTEEEIEREIQVIRCADQTCSKERQGYSDDDNVIVLPGRGPPKLPSTNANSIPTEVPAPAILEAGISPRGLVSPELPLATMR